MDIHVTFNEWARIHSANETEIPILTAGGVELRSRRPIYVAKNGARKMQVSIHGLTGYHVVMTIRFRHNDLTITCDALFAPGVDYRFKLPFPLSADYYTALPQWLARKELRSTPRNGWAKILGWRGRGSATAISKLWTVFNVLQRGKRDKWEEAHEILAAAVYIPAPDESLKVIYGKEANDNRYWFMDQFETWIDRLRG